MSVLDLTNLFAITAGDKELEHKLFTMFISNSCECLERMNSCCNKKISQQWQRDAHSLKGLALNVGAAELARLSLEAEKLCSKTMYDKIVKEYAKVEKEIKKLIFGES